MAKGGGYGFPGRIQPEASDGSSPPGQSLDGQMGMGSEHEAGQSGKGVAGMVEQTGAVRIGELRGDHEE